MIENKKKTQECFYEKNIVRNISRFVLMYGLFR